MRDLQYRSFAHSPPYYYMEIMLLDAVCLDPKIMTFFP